MRIALTTSLLLLVLTACAGPAAPPDVFYRIEPAAPARRFAKPVLPGTVEVARITADGVVDERPVAFSKGEGGPLGHYKYDLWSEPPSLMLQDRLRYFLAAAALADRVVAPELQVLPDWIVRGKVRRFEQIAGSGQVAVEMELSVVGTRDGSLILQETYSTRIKAASERVEDAAAAIQAGVSEIFARFLADLGRTHAGAPSP